jgi:uncharacterized membrane protein
MLLWYMLIAFPMLVLCGVISLEYQRILTGARVAQTLADTSAKFSTQQVLDQSMATQTDYAVHGCPDEELQASCLIKGDVAVTGKQSVSQAVSSFVKVYTDAVNANEGARHLTVTSVRVVDIRQASYDASRTLTPAQVTVEISYKVPSVGFLGLGRLLGASATEGTYVARGYGQICQSGSGETVTKECVGTAAD